MSEWTPPQPWRAQAQAVAPELLRILKLWQGDGHPPGRRELAVRLGVSDRVLRAAIVALRRQGHLVIPDPDNGGYRFARSLAEVRRFTTGLRDESERLREVAEQLEQTAARQFR